jgi:hypothetical protein
MGYQPRTDLPSLTPYLRSKYQLPPNGLAEASKALREVLEKYDGTQQDDSNRK